MATVMMVDSNRDERRVDDIGCCGKRETKDGCEGGNALITIGIVLCCLGGFLIGGILIYIGANQNKQDVEKELSAIRERKRRAQMNSVIMNQNAQMMAGQQPQPMGYGTMPQQQQPMMMQQPMAAPQPMMAPPAPMAPPMNP
jgi:hypothetical protein